MPRTCRLFSTRHALLCAALLGACAAAAQAQTQPAPGPAVQDLAALPLDDLLNLPVSGASRFIQRASEAASSVSVLTAAEIRAFGWRTLAQALGSLRGLSVSTDNAYSYLGVRGFSSPGDYNTRVLLLIDGNRINDNVYDAALLGSEFPLDLDLVERIEFVAGPGSAVYGANALFGVVNVITRQASDWAQGGSVRLGADLSREARVGGRTALGDGGTLLWSATRRAVRGADLYFPEQAAPALSDGISRGTNGEHAGSLYLRAEHGAWLATLVHGDRTQGSSGVLDQVFGDPRASQRDLMTLADLRWQHRLDGHHEATLRGFAGNYRYEGAFPIDHPPVIVNHDQSNGRWAGLEARLLSTAFDGHTLVLGTELQRSTRLALKNYDEPGDNVYLNTRHDGWRAAVFTEDRWTLSPQWSVQAGGRVDRTETFGAQFSPRLALLWQPQPTLVAKAVYGRAWRPPNAFEAYYAVEGPGGYKTAGDQRPESVRGNELALEWRPRSGTRLAGSLFHNHADRLLVLQRDPADELFAYRNAAALTSEGSELEAEQVWDSGARLRANVGLQRTSTTGDGALAALAPRRLGKLLALSPLVGGWHLGAEWLLQSSAGAAPGNGRLNLTLSQPLPLHGLAWSFGVRNLFDQRAAAPGPDALRQPVILQPRRSWLVRADVVF